jgi:hypothetical protein
MNKYGGGGGGGGDGGGGGGGGGSNGARSEIFIKHVQVNEANEVVEHKDTVFKSEVVDLSMSTAGMRISMAGLYGRVRIVPQEDIREIDCGRGLAQLLAIDPLPSYKTLADNGVVAGMFLLIATPAPAISY